MDGNDGLTNGGDERGSKLLMWGFDSWKLCEVLPTVMMIADKKYMNWNRIPEMWGGDT
jgi:hypothetical protein